MRDYCMRETFSKENLSKHSKNCDKIKICT